MEDVKKELFPNLGTIPLKKILSSQLDINLIFLFEMLHNGYEPEDMDNIKVKGWVQTLIKKGWINEALCITNFGAEMYNNLFIEDSTPTTVIKKKRVINKTKFDEWWNIFPATDKFEFKGKMFSGTRALRLNKDECKLLFTKWVSNGDYTPDQIIQGTLTDIETRKNASLREGKNKLSFIQNSATYLRQAAFDGFIGETVEEEKPVQSDNTIDI